MPSWRTPVSILALLQFSGRLDNDPRVVELRLKVHDNQDEPMIELTDEQEDLIMEIRRTATRSATTPIPRPLDEDEASSGAMRLRASLERGLSGPVEDSSVEVGPGAIIQSMMYDIPEEERKHWPIGPTITTNMWYDAMLLINQPDLKRPVPSPPLTVHIPSFLTMYPPRNNAWSGMHSTAQDIIRAVLTKLTFLQRHNAIFSYCLQELERLYRIGPASLQSVEKYYIHCKQTTFIIENADQYLSITPANSKETQSYIDWIAAGKRQEDSKKGPPFDGKGEGRRVEREKDQYRD